MIILIIVGWLIASFICATVLMSVNPDEWARSYDDRVTTMGMSLVMWWVFLIILVTRLVLSILTIVPTFLSRILDSVKANFLHK